MTPDLLFALAGFALAMSITPGPANFILLASGANYGFRRTVPTILGISSGFLTMVFAVGMGIGQALRMDVRIEVALKFACAAYVLHLAWKIAHAGALDTGGESDGRPMIGFLQASFLQWLNPKAWAVALIVTVSYTEPADPFASLVRLIGVFALINLPAISAWAIFGAAMSRLLTDRRRLRAFNIAMALLLVGSMLPVLLGMG